MVTVGKSYVTVNRYESEREFQIRTHCLIAIQGQNLIQQLGWLLLSRQLTFHGLTAYSPGGVVSRQSVHEPDSLILHPNASSYR